MAGNVWEWTSSQFKNYPFQKEDGREEIDDISLRVVRGGSFSDDAGLVCCALRNYINIPSRRYQYIGFRVVVSPL